MNHHAVNKCFTSNCVRNHQQLYVDLICVDYYGDLRCLPIGCDTYIYLRITHASWQLQAVAAAVCRIRGLQTEGGQSQDEVRNVYLEIDWGLLGCAAKTANNLP